MSHGFVSKSLGLRRISTQIFSVNRTKVSSHAKQKQEADSYQGRVLYDPKVVKKNYGVIPLLVIVLGGAVFLSAFVVRNLMTRDDIRFSSKGKFGYQKEENLEGQRKFIALNQKFNTPKGLKELYDDLKEE